MDEAGRAQGVLGSAVELAAGEEAEMLVDEDASGSPSRQARSNLVTAPGVSGLASSEVMATPLSCPF